MTTDLNIIIRIEKLLAKAEDPGCTPAERESFQDKAFELIERYRIDKASIGGHLAADDVIITGKVGDFNGIYGRVRIQIVTEIADSMDVQIFWAGFKNTRHLKAYGFRSDVDRVIALAHRLVLDADAQVKLVANSYDMKDTLRQRRGFYEGYAWSIGSRLRTARQTAEANAARDGIDMVSTALVLVDRKKQVNEKLRSDNPNLKEAGKLDASGYDGFEHGSVVGSRADLTNQNAISHRKELGR